MTNDNNNNNATNNTTNDNARSRNARAMNNERFTLCDIARELNIDAKRARARMRRACACNTIEHAQLCELRNTNDARVRYEYDNAQRDIVIKIISRD